MDSSHTLSDQSDAAYGESTYQERPAITNHSDSGSAASPREEENLSESLRANDFLQRLYGPVLAPLRRVEVKLREEMQSPYEDVAPLLRHGTQLGGKRLRPAIHLLMARALGQITESNVVIATVIEMVHTATLVHDDVLDEAATRRHLPTINAKWNDHTSILLGDYLFAQSFRLAASLGSTRACSWVGEAARLVCEGELRQVLNRDQLQMDEETYFDIIRGKTAELCRVACSLASAEAHLPDPEIQRLAGYGNDLGIAFQIADDYLDLWGDGEKVGKTLGTDLEQGKMTLPILRLLETASASERKSIVSILQGPPGDRVRCMLPLLEQSDAKEYTASVAKRFAAQAVDSLSPLPESQAKNCLIEIANFSVQRSF